MFSPLSHFRGSLLAATPKQLLHPPLYHLSTITTAPANRASTTPVAVLWDLAASRPPSRLPLYDAAVRLHLAANSFGRLRISAAFLHPSHRLPTPSPSAALNVHLCRVCGRRFRARDALLRHFDTIHTREHAKRLERIDSSRGDRRVRLTASLSLKLSKYAKAARELTAAADPGSPADDLRRAGVRAELTRTPSASLRERAHEVLDEGSVGCLVLVSGHEELAPLLRLARERGIRSVVVGGESGLGRWADMGFSWAEVVAGKARKAAPSASAKWRDRDVLKRLEWRYEEDEEEEEEVVFEEAGDGDGIEELAGNAKGKPWWKLESDDEDPRIGG